MKRVNAETTGETFEFAGRTWRVDVAMLGYSAKRERSTMHLDYDSMVPEPATFDDVSWGAWRKAENAMLKPVVDWAVTQVNALAQTVSRFVDGKTVDGPEYVVRKASWSNKAGCACGCSPGYVLSGMPKGYMVSLVDVAHERAQEEKAKAAKLEREAKAQAEQDEALAACHS
jgi:hypothetical protein